MFYVYYTIYLLAWLFGVTRRGNSVARTKRVGIRVTIVSLLITIAFFALINGIQMGGLIFAAIPIFVLLPAFAIGIGLAVSTTANALANKDSTIFAYAIKVTSLIGPSLAILLFGLSQHTHEEQRLDDLAAFQAGDLVGQMGEQALRFPASPQLETIHTCEGDQRCYTKFLRSGDTLQDLAIDGGGTVRFVEIELIPVHSTCDGPTAPLNACLQQPKLQAWCETRAALFDSIWCQGNPRHRVVFLPVVEGNLHLFDEQNWSNAGTDSLGTDSVGDPIEIECNTRRDETILNNPHLSRYCRIKFSVAANVSAAIFLDRFEPFEMKSQATTMLDYAKEIWASVSQQ